MRAPSCSERFYFALSILVLLTSMGGCQNFHSLDPSSLRAAGTMGMAPPASGMGASSAGGQAGETSPDGRAPAGQDLPPAADRGGVPTATTGAPRQMVYTARFDIATANAEEAMGRFIRGVESAGGYLESREDCHVVCRVPAARFQETVAAMPALGSIISQTIRNDDVTRKHRDLRLHIDTAEWSRRRVLGLLEKAEKIEDIIKLEEELLKLTAAIESLQGTLQDLSEQIAYSRVEAFFRARVPETKLGRSDACSPFAWINRVGADQVTEEFGSVESAGNSGVKRLATLRPGGAPMGPLDGFLVVKSDRSELKAITPDASKLWIREFAVPQRANLDFWSKALRSDLVDHRGYQLIEEKRVRDGKGDEGVEMVCDVVVLGQMHRYLVRVHALDGSFWKQGATIRTVEFVAPVATFEKCAATVRGALGETRVSDAGKQPSP